MPDQTEYLCIHTEEHDGLVYQLLVPKVNPAVLEAAETYVTTPTVVVRKAAD